MSIGQIGQDLLNVPMGDMIRQMALAIADAQVALDEAACQTALMMSGTQNATDSSGAPILDTSGDPIPVGRVSINGNDYSMLELGFTPTFYQFVDTIIEVRIAIKMTYEREDKGAYKSTTTNIRVGKGKGIQVSTSTVDGTYQSKFGYSAEGSSLLRTKLAPVPPPPLFEERIRELTELGPASTAP